MHTYTYIHPFLSIEQVREDKVVLKFFQRMKKNRGLEVIKNFCKQVYKQIDVALLIYTCIGISTEYRPNILHYAVADETYGAVAAPVRARSHLPRYHL